MKVRITSTLQISALLATGALFCAAAQPVVDVQQSNDVSVAGRSVDGGFAAGSPIFNTFTWPVFRKVSCLLWANSDPACQSWQSSQAGQSTFHVEDEDDKTRVKDDSTENDDIDTEEEEDSLHTDRHKSGWVYLIRHGEKVKNSDKTGLSARGIKRSRCLLNVFGANGDAIDFILAQDFKPDGRRARPYDTVAPLARALDIPLDHTCDREDTRCVARKIRRHAKRRGENVLVVWEHARLTKIAEKLGVTGLQYPSKRYDVVFKIRNGKVHEIYSEECNGLDEQWFNWHGKKKGKHGKGGDKGRLIDDESWADDVQEEPESAVE